MRTLDRYVTWQFVTSFVFALLALTSIFIIVDLIDGLDQFLDNKASVEVILRYYVAYVPEICELITPIALMLSGLFSIGRLSNLNEITAMKSGGISTSRMLLPILAVSLLVSFGQLYFNGWIVPKAAIERRDIERRYLGTSMGLSIMSDLAFRQTPTMNVRIDRYDVDARIASGVSVEEFGSVESPRLGWYLDVESMRWDSARGRWTGRGAVKRIFAADTVRIVELDSIDVPFDMRHDQILRLQQNTDEMTFPELAEYLEMLRKGGKSTRVAEIDLAGQWAFPFVNLIVVMISVPFASVRRRGGMAANITAALVIAVSYIAFTKISQAIGASSDFPPAVIAWSANVCFSIIAFVIFLRYHS
jgi:lipopolysaccharide export system permease protein